jgi:hypothetical protein
MCPGTPLAGQRETAPNQNDYPENIQNAEKKANGQ